MSNLFSSYDFYHSNLIRVVCVYPLDSWYRLVYDEENFKLATECLPINSCGTLAPIWMVGNYTSQGIIDGEPRISLQEYSAFQLLIAWVYAA